MNKYAFLRWRTLNLMCYSPSSYCQNALLNAFPLSAGSPLLNLSFTPYKTLLLSLCRTSMHRSNKAKCTIQKGGLFSDLFLFVFFGRTSMTVVCWLPRTWSPFLCLTIYFLSLKSVLYGTFLQWVFSVSVFITPQGNVNVFTSYLWNKGKTNSSNFAKSIFYEFQ